MEENDIKQEISATWRSQLAPYERSNWKISVRQIINTLGPLVLLWGLAYASLSVSYWLTLAFTIPAAGFLVRSFIIFHDCCHHSFFKSRKANVILGTILGIVTFFPYHQWKNEHAVHHASSGNLGRRGKGDIWTMTVAEYKAATRLHRLVYRLYRNPAVMFGIGPLYIFLFEYRFNKKGARRKERLNTHLTNLGITAVTGFLGWALGWQSIVLVEAPILYMAGVAGIWLFYVQHQFEDSYYEQAEQWSYVRAALEGSSYYRLPKLLQWLTGNIGYHHIHHLGTQVPNYHLQRTHEGIPALRAVPAVGLLQSLRSLNYRLWDETSRQFVGFKIKPTPFG